ncbi:Ethylene-responsive transcription factor CRF6 [Cardamine amara subsp. amara]|uniref:Ethylene-responsive transcription factor CRF6 n=1 Tax=Cardamine amara subsp. amara TaxID=228776 RepID=A0ABD1B9W7_CARAN
MSYKAEYGGDESTTKPVKYRGVRNDLGGKFASELQDPSTRTRLWIGTFTTVEEATFCYDSGEVSKR